MITFAQYLTEGKKFKELEKNKVRLTDEEEQEVFKQKATWSGGPAGTETSAVWKSVDKDGEVTYVTHTHRAFNTAPTLKGAIRRFHDFIKGTS